MSIAPETRRRPQFGLSDRLRKAREEAGIHEKQEFADLVGIHRDSVARYEAGKSVPRRPVLAAWAMATGVDLDWLTNGETPPSGGGVLESRLSESNRRPSHYKPGSRPVVDLVATVRKAA